MLDPPMGSPEIVLLNDRGVGTGEQQQMELEKHLSACIYCPTIKQGLFKTSLRLCALSFGCECMGRWEALKIKNSICIYCKALKCCAFMFYHCVYNFKKSSSI